MLKLYRKLRKIDRKMIEKKTNAKFLYLQIDETAKKVWKNFCSNDIW